MARTTKHMVTEFSERVWVINEFFLDTVFLVAGEERALLIDTGTGVGDLKAAVEGLTGLPVIVALTHGHVDHAGGVRQFGEVYVHPQDLGMTAGLDIRSRRNYAGFLLGVLAERLKNIPQGMEGFDRSQMLTQPPFSLNDIDDYGGYPQRQYQEAGG